MPSFLEDIFSRHQLGLRKKKKVINNVLKLYWETEKNAVDKGKVFGALLSDLSKVL